MERDLRAAKGGWIGGFYAFVLDRCRRREAEVVNLLERFFICFGGPWSERRGESVRHAVPFGRMNPSWGVGG